VYNDKLLKNEEKAVLSLRHLYKSYGYQPFKMSKFEEYELYVRNKDFLVGDSVITFNDTDGRLLALKPDVTLSIIKNTTDGRSKQKVYYNENVYRTSSRTHQFKEIMQTGVECIGDIDLNDVFEVVYLAAKSLMAVSEDFIIDLSHMGIYSALLSSVSQDKRFMRDMTLLISEKNRHEAYALLDKFEISDEGREIVDKLLTLYGDMDEVLKQLDGICKTDSVRLAYNELKELCCLLSKTEFKDRIRIDFSLLTDMRYYDGIVFKGFVNGIFDDVLSGGRYDPLMRRMGRKSGAIGFALYLDQLEGLDNTRREYDVDVLLLYDINTEAETVVREKERLVGEGKSVWSATCDSGDVRYKELVNLSERSDLK